MNWIAVITSGDLGWPRGTPERLRELVATLPKELTVLKALHFAAALGVDKDNSYRTVDERLLRGAPDELLRRLDTVKRANPGQLFVFFEPWQQLLLAEHAVRYGGTAATLVRLETAEGHALFLEACRIINDLSMPPAPPLTGEPIADALIVAANVIPRLWLMNPPNINNAIARLLIFLDELPRRHPEHTDAAAALRARFMEDLGVSFEDAVALNAFMGYWSIAPTVDAVLAGPNAVRIDPEIWLRETTIPRATFETLLARIAQPVEALCPEAPAGAGNPWFDPLSFRDRPLVRFPDGTLIVTMPEFLMEKASFEIFWWLTGGPGGAAQRRAWQQAFGRLCESYVLDRLVELASPDGQEMLPNVRWNGGELDALLWHGDRLAVVEVSSGFIPNAPKMSGDHIRLREALRNRYVEHVDTRGETTAEAVAQLARDIRWLIERRRAGDLHGVPLRGIETIHPVVIAADRTVRTQGVWRYLDSELRTRLPEGLPWQVAPLAVLGLEDLEWIEQASRDRHPRLQQSLPPFLQVLRWWEFDVNRNRTFWQLLVDWLGEGQPNARLAYVSRAWLERMRSRFRTVPGAPQG